MTRLNFLPAPRKPLRLIARNAIQGDATQADREALAGMANVIMVVAEKHCTPGDLDAAQAAQMALMRADGRALQGKTWNFDSEGRAAVVAAMDMFEDIVARLGYGIITEALVTVLERKERGQVHRVEVTQ